MASSSLPRDKSSLLVGMEAQTAMLSKLLFVAPPAVEEDAVQQQQQQQQHRIGLLEGDAGSGKTRLVQWALTHSQARRNILTIADSSEMNTPFYVWRVVLQSMLALTASPMKREDVNNSSFFVPSKSSSSSAGAKTFHEHPKERLKRHSKESFHRSSITSLSSGEEPLLQRSQSSSERNSFSHPPVLMIQEQREALVEDLLFQPDLVPESRTPFEDEEEECTSGDEEEEFEKKNHRYPYLLEKLQKERKLRGRRLSALKVILPFMVTPTTTTTSSAPTTLPVLSTSKEEEPTKLLDSFQAATELMLLLLEETGKLGTTLIVIENGHFMDKQSWDLLRRIQEQPLIPKDTCRVRFLVTYRPFDVTDSHALHYLLLHVSSKAPSLIKLPSGPKTIATTTTPNSVSSPGKSTTTTPPTPPPPPQSIGSTSGGPERGKGFKSLEAAMYRIGESTADMTVLIGEATIKVGEKTWEGGVKLYDQAVHHRPPLLPQHSTSSMITATHEEEAVVSPVLSVLKIKIPPLTLRETALLLNNVYDVSTGPKLLAFLRKKSKGNPRELMECYDMLLSQHLIYLDPENGIAEEAANLEDVGDSVFVIPQHVRALLQQQFDKLAGREQVLLKLASVVGSTVSLRILRLLCEKLDNVDKLSIPLPQGLLIEFSQGLSELRQLDLIHPFLPPPSDRSVAKEYDDEEWIFESENIRFVAYSQMPHTFRTLVHCFILDIIKEGTLEVRLQEDPTWLGNHAMGAEKFDVAFQCFREAMRRAVLKGETVEMGKRLWQSCTDVVEEEEEGLTKMYHRMVIDVLLAQIAIENLSWDEAKASLIKVRSMAEYAEIPLVPGRTTACFGLVWKPPALFRRRKPIQETLWDPLEVPIGERKEAMEDLIRREERLAQSLFARIQRFESEKADMARSIQLYSERKLSQRA